MAKSRNFHGLTDSGEFYRDRDEWLRFVASRDEWEASWRLVCMYIALRANPTSQEPYPRQSVIARDLGLSVATVKRGVKQAVKMGLLKPRQRVPAKGKKPVNHYQIVHPAEASEVSPMTPHSGVTHDPQNNGTV